MNWTEQRDRQLRILARNGECAIEISRAIGVNVSEVWRRSYRLGVKIKKVAERNRERSNDNYAARLTWAHGADRAERILAGDDEDHNADVDLWRQLGNKGARQWNSPNAR